MAVRQVPRFRSEKEEADWWDRNRTELDRDFLEAARKGQLRRLDRKQLEARVAGATKVISLRLPEADLALAREQAARKGLPYQTYLKSLLHEALRRTG
jgi:predicted DNA binding CopG/RHH family protein